MLEKNNKHIHMKTFEDSLFEFSSDETKIPQKLKIYASEVIEEY